MGEILYFLLMLISVSGSPVNLGIGRDVPFILQAKSSTSYTSQLKFVAYVDGKVFFLNITRMDWSTASKSCESAGLKLVSITSEAQFSTLNSLYPIYSVVYFWTSGTDTLLPSQFYWSGPKTNLSHPFLPLQNRQNITTQTCIGFENRPSSGSVLFPYPCSSTLGATLCELTSCPNA